MVMSPIAHTEQHLSLPRPTGKPCRALLRSPNQAAEHPMLLVNLAKDCRGTTAFDPADAGAALLTAPWHSTNGKKPAAATGRARRRNRHEDPTSLFAS